MIYYENIVNIAPFAKKIGGKHKIIWKTKVKEKEKGLKR